MTPDTGHQQTLFRFHGLVASLQLYIGAVRPSLDCSPQDRRIIAGKEEEVRPLRSVAAAGKSGKGEDRIPDFRRVRSWGEQPRYKENPEEIRYVALRPERQRLIRALFDEYIEMYASRDDRLTGLFSRNFSGYTGGDFLVRNRTEWVKITRQDFSQVTGRIRIEIVDILPVPDHILARETARPGLVFRTDCLTGIANRRSFDYQFSQEWIRTQRAGTPLALIMLDIDLFKHFNDHYGHIAGDTCLRTLAPVLAQAGARWGSRRTVWGRGICRAVAEYQRA